ncbi:MAG: FAD-binding oxidoreductase [Candidatus Marinimicrobia bacterium]|jgi:alkyldihydroxyacetonephosphate synthase|nr:FAD-binding oxidoreductase [Candidatus Neomarinimicrobiota bacterium]MDP6401537.1 FAD-binding oxidoreductase [Candidatus Neomarinimicrobiota bacterium]MDP7273298.1 FAD-binding oxidoreductase [Candidatus Neomarinimicrobiota bacterium]MEC9307237.1 FAD-binding oxidoreductase [Candidatus Neomarinimicrobiota bacterium]HJM34086.1 FAD-binding oxidoreductase [Candidatus Neomarinimicrobiota bacterium]|tara:strand:+ start:550 stop:2319 length:1770 start_codon:yes stop_codon:yes gene_type:complete
MSETDKSKIEKFFAVNDTNWGHKWGYKDSRFVLNEDRSVTMAGDRYDICGVEMPDFIPYVEEMLDITVDPNDTLQEVENKPVREANINIEFVEVVKSEFPEDRYSFGDDERLLHSQGQTTDEVYKILYSRVNKMVDMVFFIESEEEVRRLIQLAMQYDVCLIPYGGGTSVSNALKVPENEQRMIVAVDTRRMAAIESIDEENRRICVQAGITGGRLEELLQEKGFTVGHEPDSIELSTLGGWISTNASGMKKNRYGNIEDIIENVTMITPQGVIEQVKPLTRASIGVKPQNMLLGSEGNFGIITKATLKLHKLPEVQTYNSAIFKNWKTGVDFMYDLSQSDSVPASARLMDNAQFRFGQALKARPQGMETWLKKIEKFWVLDVKGFDPYQMVGTSFKMEGSREEVEYQQKHVEKLTKKYNGLVAGAENGKRGYMLTFAIAYIRDFMSDYHIIGETMETSVPWSKIHPVCEAASNRLHELHDKHEIPGKPYISYRIPQIYHTGVCIYFMFAISVKGVKNAIDLFHGIEHSMREAIMESGGSISHHHGVGKLRKDFMSDTLSPASIDLLKQIKNSHDPENIFGVRNNIFYG